MAEQSWRWPWTWPWSGSGNTNKCPGGYFCENVDSRELCPEGSFCAPGECCKRPLLHQRATSLRNCARHQVLTSFVAYYIQAWKILSVFFEPKMDDVVQRACELFLMAKFFKIGRFYRFISFSKHHVYGIKCIFVDWIKQHSCFWWHNYFFFYEQENQKICNYLPRFFFFKVGWHDIGCGF